MTDKILTHFAVLLISFFAVWFGLSHVKFIDQEELRGFAKDNEKRLGELILESITTTSEKIKNEKIHAVIDSIKVRICRTKAVDCDKIKIHIIRNSEINAFALPDNHMVIYTGLIEYAANPEEVAGVMAHEIGHMEKNHVMKKLVKEIGLEMLFAIAGGDAGHEIVRQTGKTLSSGAFDRKQEREADGYAVETLALSSIDPQHLGNLFFRLSQKHSIPEALAWISTHPDSKERAADIIKKKKEFTFGSDPVIKTAWEQVKNMLQDEGSVVSTETTPGPAAR
ncbi:MAG: M48 family metallopeptidase [Cyclobacteriaceae bacterium]